MDHASVAPRSIAYHLLEEMTNGFSEDRELGSGSYGKVYLGLHKDGQKIAVKVLRLILGLDGEQFEKEYHNLESLRHKNIVRLVGFCNETQRNYVLHEGKMVLAEVIHRALCFEYMQNGSLDNCLSDESSGHDWHTRYAIIKGICEGLKYLHEEMKPPIYHLDLKPANILLDENNVPKIADFGLSRLIGEEGTRITTSFIGTIGYLPPEFINQHVISNKLDIFSLGVIILKIVTGPTGYSQSAEMSSQQFIDQVHRKWRNRLQATSVHALELYCKQVKRCIKIALSSVEVDRHKRPTVGDIVNELNETEKRKLPYLLRTMADQAYRLANAEQKLMLDKSTTREKYRMLYTLMSKQRSETENIFGEIVNDYKLDQMERYTGKPKTREDRAREAYNLRYEEDRCAKAGLFLYGFKGTSGSSRSVLCNVYNATGDMLFLNGVLSWRQGAICTPSYPVAIGNGQWAVFHHAPPKGEDSIAAVVYRGKNKDGEHKDYLLAWNNPKSIFFFNTAYCEIGDIDYFKTKSDNILDKLDKLKDASGSDSSTAKSGGCMVSANIDIGKRPWFHGVISSCYAGQ